MTRGSCLPVLLLALAALPWPPAVYGQLLKRAAYLSDSPVPVDGRSPNPESPAEENPRATERVTPEADSWLEQTPAPHFDAAAVPFAPAATGLPEYGPDGGMLYGEPAVCGGCGRRSHPHGLSGCLFAPPGRHRGVGHPLQRESWLYRPFSAGWFAGMVQGGPLIDDWLGQERGFFGGYRFGWDQDYYWGGEMRFAFGSVRLYDSQQAIDAQQQADDLAGLAPDDPWRNRFDPRRDADLFQWDLSVLYYPWGDSLWRPYLLAGLGSARLHFTDRLSRSYDKVVFAMPLAAGVKYRCNDWLALRFECADNIAFGGGSGFDTVHNVSATGGMEVRFGGSRKAYWPWNPGRHYW